MHTKSQELLWQSDCDRLHCNSDAGNVSTRAIFPCDILMLSFNPGGKARTFDKFMALAKAAGFAGIRSVCNVSIYVVMEFYK